MEPFFTFLASYWWLVFPLVGVMGMLGGAWERGAKRRHERRLEILRAKSELRAARSVAPTATGPRAPAADRRAPETQADALRRLLAAHDAVTARWLDYELDVAKLIAYPAMSDGRQPLTAAFLRARKAADNLRPPSARTRLSKEQLADYRAAVTEYEVAFDLAERDAKRLRDSGFSAAERRRLETAQQLLAVAVDRAATPAERQLAYRRVRDELDGLISLSDEAIEVLEEKVALELPAAPGNLAPPAPGASTAPRDAPATWPVPARSPSPGRVVRPKSR